MTNLFSAGGTGLRSKTDDVMRNLFGRTQHDSQAGGSPTVLTGPRMPRHSSAWKDLLKYLKSEQGLRILDIGPTSPTNINFLTTLGHGVYMADVVNEALRVGLSSTARESKARFKVEPHSFGFKPGIDPNKLNQLIDDLEAEEFLKKMPR